MATATVQVISALNNTANKISSDPSYQWGHMGACNCGFLAQEITHLKKDEIHARAMERYGDWQEQLRDYCPTSGMAMDDLISAMLSFGFDADDLKHLERLSDAQVLQTLPPEQRNVKHNVKEDVVKYLRAWARSLEERLSEKVVLDDLIVREEI